MVHYFDILWQLCLIDFFYKTFAEYEVGFESKGEGMVGLKDLHKLTSGGNYRLQVDLKDFSNKCYVAVYEQFKIGPGDGYILTATGYNSGLSTAADGLATPYNPSGALFTHNGMKFSTWDKMQDTAQYFNCAQAYKTGWWFGACYSSLLTATSVGAFQKAQYTPYLVFGGTTTGWYTYKEAKMTMKLK